MASTAETPRALQLGAELRNLRKDTGMSMIDLADQLGRRHSHISRWENGKMIPSEADMGAILGLLGVTGTERQRLLRLARDAADPNWVAPGVERQLAALMEYERTADVITNVEPLLVPGLLQTSDYARAIMTGAGANRGEIEQRVTMRMGRRDILTRGSLRFRAVVGEHALRYPPCEPLVMVDQLRQLRKWAEASNITVQVLPLAARYTPVLEGAFVLLEFPHGRPVVQMEHYRSSTTITDSKDARDYQAAADTLVHAALSTAESDALIAAIAEETERTT